ncbi:MAG: exonuclease domain-containing protein [Traorella sp.]
MDNILMNHNFTFLDVETPNYSNSSISSIAIIHLTCDGEIIQKYSLVNPQQHFDSFNIRLTGITPKMVEDQPTFVEVWEDIKEYFKDSILVAHNARFDLLVLHKCFQRYHIDEPDMYYMCTVDLSRHYIPSTSHKLNVLCDILGIELNHHQADSDTSACMQIFMYMNDQFGLKESEIKKFQKK